MRTAPTVSPPAAANDPIVAQLQRFTNHRRWNRPLAMQLHKDPELHAYAQDMANCSRRLGLELPMQDGELGRADLVSARLCNRRLCPFCEWRRARAWRARILSGIEAYGQDHPKASALLLTLTVRNCPVGDLRQTLRDMHAAWNRMARCAWFPSDAWLRRTEITVKTDAGPCTVLPSDVPQLPAAIEQGQRVLSCHPHLHVLMMVRPSYFTRDYIKQSRWRDEWCMAARLDYSPVVDIRKCKPARESSDGGPVSSVSVACEVGKYIAKATDLQALGPCILDFHHQIRDVRMIGFSRVMSRYASSAPLTKGELFDAVPESDANQCNRFALIAEWLDSVSEYRIAP